MNSLLSNKWLRKLGFFEKYPELIMDRLCECLTTKEYSRDEVIINKGDESTFMIILYTGKINIYLHSYLKSISN